LTVVNIWHVLAFDDTPDLGLETHVQHSVSLVENEVLDVGKRDSATLHQVDKTAWGSREKIATTVKGTDLLSDVGTTVDDSGTSPRSVGELAGLLVNLRDQLTGRGKDKGGRVDLAATIALFHGWRGGTIAEHGGKDGEEETTSLSGTSLRTSHKITTTSNDRDRVLLDGSRGSISRVSDVLKKDRVDRRVGKLGHRFGNAVTSGLDGDIGVLVEVDTGTLFVSISQQDAQNTDLMDSIISLAEELLLHTSIALTDNVAVLP